MKPQNWSSQLSGFSKSNGLNVGAVSVQNVSAVMEDVVRWAKNRNAVVLDGAYSNQRVSFIRPYFNITIEDVTR